MTPLGKLTSLALAEATALAAAVTIDVDPGAVLVGASSLTGGALLWLAQGWWKDWRDAEVAYRKNLADELKAIRLELAAIKERHTKEDGAAEAEADRRQR